MNQKARNKERQPEEIILIAFSLDCESRPNPIIQHLPSHCSPRAHPELNFFISFPDPRSQQQPIPLLNTFLLTAVQGPNPNSLFFFFPRPVSQQQPIPLLDTLLLTAVRGPTPNSVFHFFPDPKINSNRSHYSTSSLSLQSKDPHRIQFFVFSPTHKSTTSNPITQQLPSHCSPGS